MSLKLLNYQQRAQQAVKIFWQSRDAARRKQVRTGKVDQGERSGVTGGKNMEGFVSLVGDLVKLNGLPDADIHLRRAVLALPGFFRPTKLWDVLVMLDGRLLAAIELKSHIGPSFGNNFNNRAEEAIGSAHDFWTAYREGAFGDQPRPFIGWLILVEDAHESRRAVQMNSPHFPIFKEFTEASYLDRYDLLCQKLMKEGLYTAASLLASPRKTDQNGEFTSLSEMTCLKVFVSSLAAHIAAEAARLKYP